MIRNQRGGIVSFGIVTLVLVGLLAGGLYASKHQARVARETDTAAPQVSAPKETQNEAAEQTRNDPTPAETGSQTAPTQPAATTTPTTPAPAATTRVANTGPTASLPETGPADIVAITLGLSALAFTGYQLLQSRRSLHRAALRK